jgi:hypothetical protein
VCLSDLFGVGLPSANIRPQRRFTRFTALVQAIGLCELWEAFHLFQFDREQCGRGLAAPTGSSAVFPSNVSMFLLTTFQFT